MPELFLDEYPRWEIEAPNWSVILHQMFLHATMRCQEADQSAMKLVGYQTSRKEIRDLYHSVYLLRRSPGFPPCGSQQRREAIYDILSSLRNCLHQWVYPITAEEDTQWAVNKSWSRSRVSEDPHEEALWEARVVHQRALEATQVLESDIKRLSWGLRDVQWTRPCSGNSSHFQSWFLDRQLRSPCRYWQERRVTCWEPEVKSDPEERPFWGVLGQSSGIFPENGDGVLPSSPRLGSIYPLERPMAYQNTEGRENYPQSPPSGMLKPGSDWWDHQLDMPCWWMELTAIPVVEDPWKLTWKIWASFSIPAVRSRVFPGQGYTTPPAPKCLTWNVFLPDELSYQDMQQHPFLLTVAYVQGLQYWVERLNLPVDPDFCPLVRSVLEFKERVKEHVVFSIKDVIQGLGRIDPGTVSWWPQTTPTDIRSGDSSYARTQQAHVTTSPSFGPIPERRYTMGPSTSLQVEDQLIGQDANLIEVATQTASATMSGVEFTSPIAPSNQMEEKWYVLVLTASIRSLNLEMTGVVLGTQWPSPLKEELSRIPIWQLFSQEGWSATKAPLWRN